MICCNIKTDGTDSNFNLERLIMTDSVCVCVCVCVCGISDIQTVRMCLHVCERKRQMRGVKRDLIRTSKLPREPWEIFFTEVNSEADKPCRNVQIWMRGIDFFIECTSMGDARITHPSLRRDLFQIRASLDCSFHMGLALGGGELLDMPYLLACFTPNDLQQASV